MKSLNYDFFPTSPSSERNFQAQIYVLFKVYFRNAHCEKNLHNVVLHVTRVLLSGNCLVSVVDAVFN